eukprot:TRINITY_DN38093_c0_g1_i1.p1 TRINITY_DN38093_c0_g1~~TRINITY_DN38093_c0_g1_i1.p1  ORF type:complete len:363 (-),score=74.23 TRINITY_DN38093_c0_g1_i1:184-1215(-)
MVAVLSFTPSLINFVFSVLWAAHAKRAGHAATKQGTMSTEPDFNLPKGPHKCTITWPGKGVRESKISFGVSSCPVQCLASNADHRYNRMFAHAFKAEQLTPRICSCQFVSTGDEALRIVGTCPADGPLGCYEDYVKLATNELTQLFEKNSLTIVPHPELTREQTFDYNNPSCIPNGCEGGDCAAIDLPDLWSVMRENEQRVFASLVKQAARKTKLTGEQKQILVAMGKKTIQEAAALAVAGESSSEKAELERRLRELEKQAEDGDALVATLSTDPEREAYDGLKDDDGALTVAALKAAFKRALSFNDLTALVNVDAMAKVAKLGDADHKVTFDEFKRFTNPEC